MLKIIYQHLKMNFYNINVVQVKYSKMLISLAYIDFSNTKTNSWKLISFL